MRNPDSSESSSGAEPSGRGRKVEAYCPRPGRVAPEIGEPLRGLSEESGLSRLFAGGRDG